MLSAKEAATAVGMSKAGIIRAIHTGKLSATRDANQQFEIDPAELFRVYDPVSIGVNSASSIDGNIAGNGSALPVCQCDNYRQQVSMLERIVRDKDDVITDLRRRLDRSADEQERTQAILLALQTPQPQRKGFWARLVGGGD